MMKSMVGACALLVLAACGPRDQAEVAPAAGGGAPVAGQPLVVTQAATGCAAAAEAAWEPVSGELWRIDATAEGAVCMEAAARLVVRAPNGAEALRLELAAPMSPVLFAEATTPESMAAALETWAIPDLSRPRTGVLPAWPDGASMPDAGEFAFYPELEREAYEAWRAADAPMLCLIQGGESLGCHALDPANGRLVKIGSQSFPG